MEAQNLPLYHDTSFQTLDSDVNCVYDGALLLNFDAPFESLNEFLWVIFRFCVPVAHGLLSPGVLTLFIGIYWSKVC